MSDPPPAGGPRDGSSREGGSARAGDSRGGGSAPPESHESGSYKVGEDAHVADLEQKRLRILAEIRDPRTFGVFDEIAVAPGWSCLEVGGGAGTVAHELARRVSPGGSVLSTDVDLRFHEASVEGLEIRQHDITRDPLPKAHYDLTHARAVLQHIPERERALERMIDATRPGGWVFVEDSDFGIMLDQPIPEPFGSITRAMFEFSEKHRQWDGRFGRRLLALFQEKGLGDAEVRGATWTMRGGTPSAEWWVLAIEHAGPVLAAAGLFSAEQVQEALEQSRRPGFAIQSPLSVSAWGRVPAGD